MFILYSFHYISHYNTRLLLHNENRIQYDVQIVLTMKFSYFIFEYNTTILSILYLITCQVSRIVHFCDFVCLGSTWGGSIPRHGSFPRTTTVPLPFPPHFSRRIVRPSKKLVFLLTRGTIVPSWKILYRLRISNVNHLKLNEGRREVLSNVFNRQHVAYACCFESVLLI